jgi:ubiquinone/menaquinone biosynthesis C-methylase UbiE
MARYDSIGINYADLRIPDARIAAAIAQALGPARSILNVGAGTGSYEPTDRDVTAVEPSIEMIRKRRHPAAAVVQASADALPFANNAFDAAMAILTIHHWPDKQAGLREMRRVTKGRIVLLTFDPAQRPWLSPVRIEPLWVPHDCTDGFLYAYWRRPEAYLDAHIRSGSSSFWALRGSDAGLARLADDLQSGAWARRYGDLRTKQTYDAGYRLVFAEPESPAD